MEPTKLRRCTSVNWPSAHGAGILITQLIELKSKKKEKYYLSKSRGLSVRSPAMLHKVPSFNLEQRRTRQLPLPVRGYIYPFVTCQQRDGFALFPRSGPGEGFQTPSTFIFYSSSFSSFTLQIPYHRLSLVDAVLDSCDTTFTHVTPRSRYPFSRLIIIFFSTSVTDRLYQ